MYINETTPPRKRTFYIELNEVELYMMIDAMDYMLERNDLSNESRTKRGEMATEMRDVLNND